MQTLHIHRWLKNHPEGVDPAEEFDMSEPTGMYEDHDQYSITLATGEVIEIRIMLSPAETAERQALYDETGSYVRGS